MHGFVPKDKVKRGKAHGMYKDGSRTLETQKQSSEQSARLQMIEDAMYLLNMTTAKRSPGRKALGYRLIKSINEVKKLFPL